MPKYGGRNFNAQLPATPCVDEMRERMIAFATKEGLSVAEVQRRAFSLFLRRNDSKAITSASNTVKQPERAS